MTYRFKSKEAADLIMLNEDAQSLLRIVGKEPASQGIFVCEQMPQAIERLEAAIAQDERDRAQAEQEAAAEGRTLPPRSGVSMRVRLWPMIEMLKRCHADGHPIVWGV